MKTIIHVNQHVIKQNRKTGDRKAPLTVKNYKQTQYAHTVCGVGAWKLVYQPDKPLSCGAQVWIEVDSETIGANIKCTTGPFWPLHKGLFYKF